MRPLRVLICPHTLELGGSQLNAVELAGALLARGHDVAVHGPPGVLVDRVRAVGLDFLEARPSRFRPGAATALGLRGLVRARQVDVVHGWEWPPILEARAATTGTPAVAVGSIMSMAVAPFIPGTVPLTVGTHEIRDEVARRRHAPTYVLEPPVDTERDRPGVGGAEFADRFPAPPGTLSVVVVCRLVQELKLEGLLTAVDVAGRLAPRHPLRLVVVGDGAAAGLVQRRADEVNAAAGREVVLLTGALDDPRGAYDAADVAVGMGGSALRAMAFGAPLIVQGEGGFFELLTPHSAPDFLRRGWYGIGARSGPEAADHLEGLLETVLGDAPLRARLGAFGLDLARSRFALDDAAAALERVYTRALQDRPASGRDLVAGGASAAGLVAYKLRRRADRVRGTAATDDFNARQR